MSPNATNAIATSAAAWLDARAPDERALDQLLTQLTAAAGSADAEQGVAVSITQESRSAAVTFADELETQLAATLGISGLEGARLPTAAGHDAGVLAAELPTAMLFVRNPTGVSHSPAEFASEADCAAGVEALAAVLEELACR